MLGAQTTPASLRREASTTAERLAEANLHLARRIAARYPRWSILNREELQAEAMYGLVRASLQYTEKRSDGGVEVGFEMFAWGYMRRQINHALEKGWRRRQQHPLYAPEDLSSLEEKGWAESADPLAVVIARETSEILYQHLAELGERERRILVAVYWEGLTQAEVARSEGVSRNRANVLLRRAEKHLKERMSETRGRDCRNIQSADSGP